MMPDKGHNDAIFRAIRELMQIKETGARSPSGVYNDLIEDLRITMIGADGVKLEGFIADLVEIGRRVASELDPTVPAYQGVVRHIEAAIKEFTETLKGTWKAPAPSVAHDVYSQALALREELRLQTMGANTHTIAIGKSHDFAQPIIYVWASYFAPEGVKKYVRERVTYWVEWRYSGDPSAAVSSTTGVEKL